MILIIARSLTIIILLIGASLVAFHPAWKKRRADTNAFILLLLFMAIGDCLVNLCGQLIPGAGFLLDIKADEIFMTGFLVNFLYLNFSNAKNLQPAFIRSRKINLDVLFFLILFQLVLLIVFLDIVWTENVSYKNIIKQNKDHFSRVNSAVANQISSIARSFVWRMEDLATSDDLRSCLNPGEHDTWSNAGICKYQKMSEFLKKEKMPEDGSVNELTILNNKGIVIGSTNPEIKEGDDYSKKDIFTGAIERGKVFNAVNYAKSNNIAIEVSAPILWEGKTLGVLYGLVDPRPFFEIFWARAGLFDQDTLQLIDGEGNVLSPDRFSNKIKLEQKASWDFIDNCNNKDAQTLYGVSSVRIWDSYDNFGNAVWRSSSHVKEANWCLASETKEREYAENSRDLNFKILTISLIFGSILSAGLAIFLSWLTSIIINNDK